MSSIKIETSSSDGREFQVNNGAVIRFEGMLNSCQGFYEPSQDTGDINLRRYLLFERAIFNRRKLHSIEKLFEMLLD